MALGLERGGGTILSFGPTQIHWEIPLIRRLKLGVQGSGEEWDFNIRLDRSINLNLPTECIKASL